MHCDPTNITFFSFFFSGESHLEAFLVVSTPIASLAYLTLDLVNITVKPPPHYKMYLMCLQGTGLLYAVMCSLIEYHYALGNVLGANSEPST